MNALPHTQIILDKLENVKPNGDGWQSLCPSHDDKNPSLSITEKENGKTLLHCHAGCSLDEILIAIESELKDLFPDFNNGKYTPAKTVPRTPTPSVNGNRKPRAPQRPSQVVATYDYIDENDEPVLQVVKYDPKGFSQRRPNGKGGWTCGAKDVRKIVYRLPELLANPNRFVLVVEGEKDVDNLMKIDVIATTNAGGAEKWTGEHSEFLSGREVVIVADNDEPGEKHVNKVAASLNGIAKSIRILRLPGLKEKQDISDWLEQGGDKARLTELIDNTELWTPPKKRLPIKSFRPFPVHALPQSLRELITEGAQSIGCDESMIALPVLAVLAAAVGGSRTLLIKHGWFAPCALWTIVISKSGSGKTPSHELALKPTKKRQSGLMAEYDERFKEFKKDEAIYKKALKVWERKADKDFSIAPPIEPDRPAAERCWISDITIEAVSPIFDANPRGLLLARDELQGWLGSFDRYSGGNGGGDEPCWLSMYNGSGYIVDRKTGIKTHISVRRSLLSIAGGVQPGIAARSFSLDKYESGLVARFIPTYPPEKKKTFNEKGIDPAIEERYAATINRLYDLQPILDEDGNSNPAIVRLSSQAKKAYKTFYNSHNLEREKLDDNQAAAWAKIEELPARLSLIIQFAKWAELEGHTEPPTEIDLATMQEAIEITQWAKYEVQRVYTALCETPEEKERRDLIHWTEKQQSKGEKVTARLASRNLARFDTSEQAEAAFNDLVKIGYGTWNSTEIGKKGGSSKKFFLLTTPADTDSAPFKPEKNIGIGGLSKTPEKSQTDSTLLKPAINEALAVSVEKENENAKSELQDRWGEL